MLGIQGNIIKRIKQVDGSTFIEVETKPKLHTCPSCECSTKRVHDYRIQKIQHIQINGCTSYLILKKRRYLCTSCGKKFYEDYKFLQKTFRKSNNVYNAICSNAKQIKNIKTIAEDNSVSSPTVTRYINYYNFLADKSQVTVFPKRIGIDEFKGNTGTDKYQLQIINLDTNQIVDIVESRRYDDLELYFSHISNRSAVELVSMDLYQPFKKIIQDKFTNAQIVADKFHYTRIVMSILDKLRIEVQKDMDAAHRKYFKGIKKILMMREKELRYNGKIRLSKAFELSPKLKAFYEIKERFLTINDTIGYKEKESLFRQWLFDTENTKYTEFKSCLKTLRAWHKYISNSFKYSISNGPTEGKNNFIKVLKRISFGFRNFDNFRNRILITVQ